MRPTGLTKKQIVKNLPARIKKSCKSDYGRVLVIAGSSGMAGAGVLASRAALKSGAGLVTLAIVKSQQDAIVRLLPEVMTLPLKETDRGTVSEKSATQIIRWQKTHNPDSMLIGPGLGFNNHTIKFVKKILQNIKIPFVLDADGLNAISKIPHYRKLFAKNPPHILTPHPGEAKRLLKTEKPMDRIGQIKALQTKTKGVVILKGYKTLIFGGDKIYQNTTGGPELAKGGSGDILAGLTLGLWAQIGKQKGFSGKSAFQSAITAVYLHGLCGDFAKKDITERCVLAGELLDYLPDAIKKVKKNTLRV